MVDLSCRIPSQWKLPFGKLRHFYKQSFRDFLPPQLQTKPKHGFGLPFGIWMQQYEPLRELTFDSLNSLKKRGIVRPDFIDQLMNQYLREHSAYYGTFVWVLMMLEQWFQNHIDTAGETKS